jgi:ABC-2 type transport system ATP-binding protein
MKEFTDMEVKIEQLNKIYRGNVHALNNLTLTIPTGMFGLLGPNGAGKTTLMRTLAGILHPTSGQLKVGPYDGTTERGRLAIQNTLGYLPQDIGFYPDLSAREFLDYIGLLKGMDDNKARKQRVETLLEMVALREVATRKIKTYSGGMKRRVGIAQALLNDPRLLIVDEPTAGLDPEERIRFRNLLSDLSGDRTILLSTHIVEDIAQTCENIALMKKGQVIFQGTILEMLEQTRDHVWLLTTQGARPGGNCTIVSTLHLGKTVQYRIVGTPDNNAQTLQLQPTEPSLEDGYVWFMHNQPAQ